MSSKELREKLRACHAELGRLMVDRMAQKRALKMANIEERRGDYYSIYVHLNHTNNEIKNLNRHADQIRAELSSLMTKDGFYVDL